MVRYRIDGVLRQVMKIPRNAGLPLISRIKIMSGLDIADRLRPQDGRARVSVNGEAVDLRVSTLPASLGEKVVIRILSQRATVLTLEALGMHEDERSAVKNLLDNKEGIILVTGPTGRARPPRSTPPSGWCRARASTSSRSKTRSNTGWARTSSRCRSTKRPGLTFASALRSILRQDPDVVLDRRDPRPGDGADRGAGVAHRPPGALHAAHQRRAQRRHPSGRHGHGGVQDRLGAPRRRGAAAHAADLPRLPRRRPPSRCRSGPRRFIPAGHQAVQGGRLPRVLHDRAIAGGSASSRC